MCLPVTPYKIEREWKHGDLSCAVVLQCEAGHRCGYVRVPPTHPLHGKDFDSVGVEVHGGLTFGELEPCDDHEDGKGWWFGFDCAHYMDARYDPAMKPEDCITAEGKQRLEIEAQFPAIQAFAREGHYWSQEEVERETERLAEQLAVAA